ncbi:COG3014 family protein [Spirochaetota bacterium]
MKKRTWGVAVISLIVLLTSCASSNYFKVIKKPEKKFYSGDFKGAAKILKPLAAKKDKDQLLYMMEAGLMFHAAKNYELSNHILLKAAKIAVVKPISVSKQVKSLLSNESSTNYRGEDFEKVLIHMYAGLNFLLLKKYDSARVEFKAVNQELSKIRSETTIKSKYKMNIMAKYLTAIAYEISADLEKDANDLEFAAIEYKQILKLRPDLGWIRKDLKRLERRLDGKNKWGRKKGELIIIFQAGRGAIKKSRGPLLKDRQLNRMVRISIRGMPLKAGVTGAAILIALKNAEIPIPKFVRRSNRTRYVRITVNGRSYTTRMLEDIERTAVKNLKDNYGKLKNKLVASIITKAAVSIAAGYAAKQIAKKAGGGAFSGLIGLAVGAGTGAALFSQMKPDLRCWHTLPANLQIGRIFLNPGKYKIKLDFVGSRKSKVVDVEIKKGQKHIINERTLR